jgi:hypothetical protein
VSDGGAGRVEGSISVYLDVRGELLGRMCLRGMACGHSCTWGAGAARGGPEEGEV